MTTLYRPVKITSAEQAESLPEGTIAICTEDWPVEKSGGLWGRQGYPSSFLADTDDWTALLAVEGAEEFSTIEAITRWGETEAIYDSRENLRRDGWSDPIHIRLVTRLIPEEEA